MDRTLLHVFRNTPRGAETFRQSLYFGKRTGCRVCVYFPRNRAFVLRLGDEAIHVDLDRSYLYAPDTARDRARRIAEEMGAGWEEVEPAGQTASTLPDLEGPWTGFSLPRSMSAPQPHPWIPSAVLGPRVRSVLRAADLPVLLPAACFLPWERVDVLYGGSEHAARAVAWGVRIARWAGVPVRIVTSREADTDVEQLRQTLVDHDVLPELREEWIVEERRSVREIMQDLPRDSLVTFGAYGGRGLKEKRLGSKAELALRTLPQNLLMVGPRCPWPPLEPGGDAGSSGE
ncbi:MAG: hypothetical protein Kow0092_16410 [Deferrisomatales bacterium]